MLFRQIQQHGDNFSYLLADEQTHEAAVVDSSYNADELITTIKNQNLLLRYIINTHSHSDHTASNTELQSIFNAQTVSHKLAKINSDIKVEDGAVLTIGKISIRILYTPGHTPDSICLLVDEEKLLTGDTLFVGECGRTDMPGGNARNLYDSLFYKILKLKDKTEIYPGHDYGVKPSSTISWEKKTNYVLQPRSLKDFIAFMNQP